MLCLIPKIFRPISPCPYMNTWGDGGQSSRAISSITKETIPSHQQIRTAIFPLMTRGVFCLKASRRAVLAQSQNPSGKPGGNSKAASAFVRNVCQRMGCCYCRNIFQSLASGPSNLDPKKKKGEYSSVNRIML